MSERERWRIAVPATSSTGPWPLLVEVTRLLPRGSWTLIGGMMVQLHALRAGVPHPRATTDIDALIHVETGVISYASAARLLASAGFTEHRALHADARAHRFIRGSDVVDVLVADHAAPSVLASRSVPAAVRAPGGTRALRSTVDVTVEVDGASAALSLPDEFGALVLKSSAYAIDRRDRTRHLDDLETLLAAQSDPEDVIRRCNRASAETRSRVSAALHELRRDRTRVTSPAARLALEEFELGLLGEADRARHRS